MSRPERPETKSFQDMPPEGGFPKVRINRINPSRGPSGLVIGVLFLTMTFGGYGLHAMTVMTDLRNRSIQNNAYLSIKPYLMAEAEIHRAQITNKRIVDGKKNNSQKKK